jgi:hypothetical protein
MVWLKVNTHPTLEKQMLLKISLELYQHNLVENVKHMIIDKNSSENPYIKAKCILQQVLKRL